MNEENKTEEEKVKVNHIDEAIEKKDEKYLEEIMKGLQKNEEMFKSIQILQKANFELIKAFIFFFFASIILLLTLLVNIFRFDDYFGTFTLYFYNGDTDLFLQVFLAPLIGLTFSMIFAVNINHNILAPFVIIWFAIIFMRDLMNMYKFLRFQVRFHNDKERKDKEKGKYPELEKHGI